MKKIVETPLHIKLEIKEGLEIKLINEPEYFLDSLNGIREKVHIRHILNKPVDLIHLFTRSKKELWVEFAGLKRFMKKNGVLWISWPDKSSRIVSDLDENAVKDIGFKNGLVDVKSCSIDNNWRALKFIFQPEVFAK